MGMDKPYLPKELFLATVFRTFKRLCGLNLSVLLIRNHIDASQFQIS